MTTETVIILDSQDVDLGSLSQEERQSLIHIYGSIYASRGEESFYFHKVTRIHFNCPTSPTYLKTMTEGDFKDLVRGICMSAFH